jgi:hypothetical protein
VITYSIHDLRTDCRCLSALQILSASKFVSSWGFCPEGGLIAAEGAAEDTTHWRRSLPLAFPAKEAMEGGSAVVKVEMKVFVLLSSNIDQLGSGVSIYFQLEECA